MGHRLNLAAAPVRGRPTSDSGATRQLAHGVGDVRTVISLPRRSFFGFSAIGVVLFGLCVTGCAFGSYTPAPPSSFDNGQVRVKIHGVRRAVVLVPITVVEIDIESRGPLTVYPTRARLWRQGPPPETEDRTRPGNLLVSPEGRPPSRNADAPPPGEATEDPEGMPVVVRTPEIFLSAGEPQRETLKFQGVDLTDGGPWWLLLDPMIPGDFPALRIVDPNLRGYGLQRDEPSQWMFGLRFFGGVIADRGAAADAGGEFIVGLRVPQTSWIDGVIAVGIGALSLTPGVFVEFGMVFRLGRSWELKTSLAYGVFLSVTHAIQLDVLRGYHFPRLLLSLHYQARSDSFGHDARTFGVGPFLEGGPVVDFRSELVGASLRGGIEFAF